MGEGQVCCYSCYNAKDSLLTKNYQVLCSAEVEKPWSKAKLTSKTKTNVCQFYLEISKQLLTLLAPRDSKRLSSPSTDTLAQYRNISLSSFYPKHTVSTCPVILLSSLISKDTDQIELPFYNLSSFEFQSDVILSFFLTTNSATAAFSPLSSVPSGISLPHKQIILHLLLL